MAKGGGTVDWNSQETWERLVASIIASGVKLELKSVALYFGTTYDTLENRLRKIKKDAEVLKQEIDSGERGVVTPTRTKSTPSKPRTAKKDVLGAVANGKVVKRTPTKKTTIKREEQSGDGDDHGLNDAQPDFDQGMSFDYGFNIGEDNFLS